MYREGCKSTGCLFFELARLIGSFIGFPLLNIRKRLLSLSL